MLSEPRGTSVTQGSGRWAVPAMSATLDLDEAKRYFSLYATGERSCIPANQARPETAEGCTGSYADRIFLGEG